MWGRKTQEIAKVLSKIAKGKTAMSSVSAAKNTASFLVARVEMRTRSRMRAYEIVANGVGRSATWVRELIRDKYNRVDADIGRALDALLIRELEAEFARLSHEYEVALQSGDHPASQHVGEIQAHMGKIKTLMEGRAAW
jgi:hypothetical protein